MSSGRDQTAAGTTGGSTGTGCTGCALIAYPAQPSSLETPNAHIAELMLPLPPSLISVNVIVCEKILLERDGTYSAIRIIDVFLFKREPAVSIEPQPIEVSVLVMGKINPEDKSEHWARLLVQKPDGKTSQIGQPLRAVFEAVVDQGETYAFAEGSKLSEIAGGFTIVANIKIVPRQVGMHYILVIMDDVEVAKTPFTILELKPATND